MTPGVKDKYPDIIDHNNETFSLNFMNSTFEDKTLDELPVFSK